MTRARDLHHLPTRSASILAELLIDARPGDCQTRAAARLRRGHGPDQAQLRHKQGVASCDDLPSDRAPQKHVPKNGGMSAARSGRFSLGVWSRARQEVSNSARSERVGLGHAHCGQ